MSKFLSQGKVLLGTTLTAAVFLSGCGSDLDEFVATNTTNIIAPVAVNDAFNALGNATVNQAAAGVLANDAINGGSISSYDAVGNQGGTIVLNADGSFAYTPVFGFVGQETFAYTLSNNAGSSTATVTMTSTGSGFFVDNTAAPGGNGSQASPFNTLAAAISAANAGDTIYVSRGNGTSAGLAGAIALPAGVNLVGEGAGLVVAQTIEPQGQPPLITGPITCGGSNTISGFTIDGSGSQAIIINAVGDVTISNNSISNATNEQILCTDITGTVTISNNTFSDPVSDPNTDFITVTNINTNGDISVTNNIFKNDDGNSMEDLIEIETNGTSVMDLTFSGNEAIGLTSDDFQFGLYLVCFDTSQVSVTVDDNDFTNFTGGPIGIYASDPGVKLGGSISNNRITDVSDDDAIHTLINDDTVAISGNVVTNVDDDAIQLETEDLGGTFIVTNNNLSNAGNDAINFDDSLDNDVFLAIRDNTLTDSAFYALYVNWDGTGDLCLDITGNTVDDDMYFNNDGTGAINLERKDAPQGGPLDAVGVNNFTAGSPNYVGGTINSVDPGFCAIP